MPNYVDMGSILNTRSHSDTRTTDIFSKFQRFLSYLLNHPEASPFNLSDLSASFGLPLDQIIDYFQAIHQTFELFKTLEQQHQFEWKHVVDESSDIDSPQTLTISVKDMQNFSDLVYLAAKIPLKMTFVSSNISFQHLIDTFPSFFEARKNQWRISPPGLFFAKQFKAFKNLNAIPEQLEFENLILKIVR